MRCPVGHTREPQQITSRTTGGMVSSCASLHSHIDGQPILLADTSSGSAVSMNRPACPGVAVATPGRPSSNSIVYSEFSTTDTTTRRRRTANHELASRQLSHRAGNGGTPCILLPATDPRHREPPDTSSTALVTDSARHSSTNPEGGEILAARRSPRISRSHGLSTLARLTLLHDASSVLRSEPCTGSAAAPLITSDMHPA